MNYRVFITLAALTGAYSQAAESQTAQLPFSLSSNIELFEQNPSQEACSLLFDAALESLKKIPGELVKETLIIPLSKIAQTHTELVINWVNNILFIKAPERNGFVAAIFLEAGLPQHARLLLDNTQEFTQILGFSPERTNLLILVLITQITLYNYKMAHQAVSLLSHGDPNFFIKKGAWGNILHLITQLAMGPGDQQKEDPDLEILHAVSKTAELICIYAKIYTPTFFQETDAPGNTPAQVAAIAQESCSETRSKTRALLKEIELMLQ